MFNFLNMISRPDKNPKSVKKARQSTQALFKYQIRTILKTSPYTHPPIIAKEMLRSWVDINAITPNIANSNKTKMIEFLDQYFFLETYIFQFYFLVWLFRHLSVLQLLYQSENRCKLSETSLGDSRWYCYAY